MQLSQLGRYAVFGFCVMFTLVTLPFLSSPYIWLLTILTALLSALGVYDIIQERHAIRRNYPVIGNIRYLFERFLFHRG